MTKVGSERRGIDRREYSGGGKMRDCEGRREEWRGV